MFPDKRAISLIAMNNKGEWGVATNIEGFSFAVATENLKSSHTLHNNTVLSANGFYLAYFYTSSEVTISFISVPRRVKYPT